MSEAPILQLVLTVQFQQPLRNLTLFDYAKLGEVFPDYPVFRQVPRAGPMHILQRNTTTYSEVISDAPRVQFLTEDLQWEILFQEDRVSVGWNRAASLDQPSGYPGFNAVFERFAKERQRLVDFLLKRGSEAILPQVGEVTYSDAFRFSVRDGKKWRLEDVFTNVRSNPDFPFTTVNLTYTRVIDSDYPSHVETNISGPASTPAGESVTFLRTTVRFGASDEDGLSARFDRAHQAAQEIFTTLVKPEAFTISGKL